MLNLKKGFICQENKQKKNILLNPNSRKEQLRVDKKYVDPDQIHLHGYQLIVIPPNRRKKTQVFLAEL
ncbi:hypothetical protein EB008_02310 [bacterium]|nr:hypothetical protein [bacterium]